MRRAVVVILLGLLACGTPSGPRGTGDTAAERARAEHAASGEDDLDDQGKQWGGWRYRGSRDECFYVVGRTCYAELDNACRALKCKNGQGKKGTRACKVSGGGPATVSCR